VTFASMWADLAPIGRDGRTGGYRRFAWTSADFALREWFTGAAAEHALELSVDRAGNQWAWWGDPDRDGPGVVVGSHLDSVPDGGAYDGPLGVVSAFAAIASLKASGVTPRCPIGVVNFADEEGARFGIACAGSRLITGTLSPDRAAGLRDVDGVSLADALAGAGRDVAVLGRDDEALQRIGCFVELHIEQGRGLVDLDRAVAVASSIWPHGRWRFDLAGVANHAGTTRLSDRDDPMLALAAAITSARQTALDRGCVATIGKVSVSPNGVNAIPDRVVAWLDARGADEADPRAVAAAIAEVTGSAAVEESFTSRTVFDQALGHRLSKTLDDAPILSTGAGHDAGILALAGVPAAMLFVRNPTGVSHSPAEFAELDDCLEGVAALTSVLRELAAS
jgi:beta-ureidopropionase / N-carbamoyl-L-amino-acid hydrolase